VCEGCAKPAEAALVRKKATCPGCGQPMLIPSTEGRRKWVCSSRCAQRERALEAAEDGRLRDLRKGISFRLAATQNIDRVIADSVPSGRRQRYG